MASLAPCRLAYYPTKEDLLALLSSLCAGAGRPFFVHLADVCSAAPADLVGNLVPAPGTDKGDGYGGTWYLLCPKRYKKSHAQTYGGKRLRMIGGGKECWHPEAGSRKVEVLVDGKLVVGYFRNFSYGYYKTRTPVKRFERLGWCMVECVLEDDARYDHVLCKVYRSPRAKASSSNSAVLTSSGSGGVHPEAPPARFSAQHQVQESWSYDAPLTHVQVVHGAAQTMSSNFHEGLQPRTGPVHGGDTSWFVTGHETLPSYDALTATDTVQRSAGRQAIDGYVAEGPQPGAGLVHGGVNDTGLFSSGFSSDGELAGIDFGGLLGPIMNQTEYDLSASQVSGATTWATPPDYPFLGDLPFWPN